MPGLGCVLRTAEEGASACICHNANLIRRCSVNVTRLFAGIDRAEIVDFLRHAMAIREQGLVCICSECEPRGWLTEDGDFVYEPAIWPGRKLKCAVKSGPYDH